MDATGNLLFIFRRTLGRIGPPLLLAALLLVTSVIVATALAVDAFAGASEPSLVAGMRWFASHRC